MVQILSSLYNAPIQYYSKFLINSQIMIDEYENYVKQSYRNRCSIYTADGVTNLIIPVKYSSKNKTSMRDVRISNDTNWQHLHWNALIAAYNSTPFFEYYRDDFEKIYKKKHFFLCDLNRELMDTIINLIKIEDVKIDYTDRYYVANIDDNDYRSIINPKSKLNDRLFTEKPYYQNFNRKYGYIANLSILDLLFNMGNESLLILLSSINSNLI